MLFVSARRPVRAAIAAAGALAAGAQAQAPASKTIDDRFRTQLLRIAPDAAREEALLSGRDDIVLLRLTPLFTLHGSLTGSNTTNAFLGPADRKVDNFATADAGLRIGTRIAGRVDIFGDVSAIATRYAKFASLDYSALAGSIGASTNFGPVGIALTYQPSIVYDRNFKRRQLTQHRMQLSASLPVRFRSFTIEPSARAERVLAKPGDYTNTAYGAALTISHSLGARLPFLLYASVGYEHRSYDHYFPDLVGVKRTDRRLEGSVGAQWRLAPGKDVSVQYSYTRNRSTSDVNAYRVGLGTIGLFFRARF